MMHNALSVQRNTDSNNALKESINVITKDVQKIRDEHKQDKEDIMEKKTEEHERIWKHNSKQDQILAQHESRISTLEKRR